MQGTHTWAPQGTQPSGQRPGALPGPGDHHLLAPAGGAGQTSQIPPPGHTPPTTMTAGCAPPLRPPGRAALPGWRRSAAGRGSFPAPPRQLGWRRPFPSGQKPGAMSGRADTPIRRDQSTLRAAQGREVDIQLLPARRWPVMMWREGRNPGGSPGCPRRPGPQWREVMPGTSPQGRHAGPGAPAPPRHAQRGRDRPARGGPPEFPLPSSQEDAVDLLLGHGGASGVLAHIDPPGLRRDEVQNGGAHQAVIDHHIGLGQSLPPLDGEQARISGAGSDQNPPYPWHFSSLIRAPRRLPRASASCRLPGWSAAGRSHPYR